MASIKMCVIGLILLFQVSNILGHGMLMDPVNRGSAWKKNFHTPINYDDNGNNCGGSEVQHNGINRGRCGVCGDDYSNRQPRANENGGTYGTGTIVKTYTAGQEIEVTVEITAQHLGYFEFALCPLNGWRDIETEECFQKYPIFLTNGDSTYQPYTDVGEHKIRLRLPSNVVCDHCSFRWHWRAGNNWGICRNGGGALGCGAQETFRTCSDIRINRQSERRSYYRFYQ